MGNLQQQTTLELTRDKRDAGMQQAIEHADAMVEDWSEQARDWLILYMEAPPIQGDLPAWYNFMCEDVRKFAEAQGFPQPPTARAWGTIFRKAAVEGIITKTGLQETRKTPTAHGAIAGIWRKA